MAVVGTSCSSASLRQVVVLLLVFTCATQVKSAGNDTDYSDKTLTVTTLLEPPFMMKSPESFTGILHDALIEIGKRMNVTFKFTLQAEGKYGFETQPGVWTGSGGRRAQWAWLHVRVHTNTTPRTLQKADLAVAPLTISSKRHEVVDFTQPLVSVGLRILYAKPQPWANLQGFGLVFSPLTPGLWVVIVLMLLAVTSLFYLIGRFSPYEDAAFAGRAATYEGLTVGNSLLYSFSSLTWQGYTAAPKSYSGRTLAACWWVFSLMVITSFTANLTALFLTQEPASLSAPFLTFEELSLQSKVKYGIVEKGATSRYFNNSQRALQKRMWSQMMSDPSVFAKSIDEGVQRVRSSKGDYAFILEGPFAMQLAATQPCDLVVLGEQLGDHSYGAICDKVKHPDLCAQLSVHILKLHEEDFFYPLMDQYIGDECKTAAPGSAKEIFFRGLALFDSFGDADSGIRQEKALSLHRFGAPLLMLGLGILLSVGLLTAEIFYARRRGHVKQPYTISVPDQDRIQNPEDAH